MMAIRSWLLAFCIVAGTSVSAKPKITGGHEADVADFPYTAQVEFLGLQVCGAVVVSRKHVLTAANCVFSFDTEYYTVRINSSDLHSGGTNYTINEITIHEDFVPDNLDYNIAVLELSGTNSVQPIELADKYVVDEDATVLGWGSPTPGGEPSEKLHQANVTVLDFISCRAQYGDEIFTERMMCAGNSHNEAGFCAGDHGGPLVQNNKLIGLASVSPNCADPLYPDLYVDIPLFKEWVMKHISADISYQIQVAAV